MIRHIFLFSLLALFLGVFDAAAQIRLQGRVLSKAGEEPLVGASVLVEGTARGAVTNEEGRFELTVDTATYLQVSYVGFLPQRVRGVPDSVARIILTPDPGALSEVLVLTPSERSFSGLQYAAPYLRLSGTNLETDDGFQLTTQLDGLAGVQVQNGALNTNRLSIRGIGARTPFSTNQVRLFWNDIPVTNGAGESALEDLPAGAVEMVTVFRGPAPPVLGANLGGAIQLTSPAPAQGGWNIGTTVGEFGRRHHQLRLDLAPSDSWRSTLHVSALYSDGYRDNNDFRRLAATLFGAIGKTSSWSYLVHARHIKAEIPSSLNATDFVERPERAAFTWEAVNAREDQTNLLGGITHHFLPLGSDWQATTTLFAGLFANDEVRPFNVLQEDSPFAGLRTSWTFDPAGPLLLRVGGEVFGERYEQATFETLETGESGNLLAAQGQRRWYTVAFLEGHYSIRPSLRVEAGLTHRRAGYRLLSVAEEATTNLDASLLPNLRLSYDWEAPRLNLFALVSRGITNPDPGEVLALTGAQRPDLAPPTGWNYEAGLRSLPGRGRIGFELTAFRIDLENELVARQTADQQTFFINGGESRYRGIEGLLDLDLSGRGLELRYLTSLSLGDYIYRSFMDNGTDFSGNHIPGIPRTRWLHRLRVGIPILELATTLTYTDPIPVNDANTTSSPAYWRLDLRLNSEFTLWDDLGVRAFAGVENLTDVHYASQVQINASGFGGNAPRHFYPGLPRYFYLGVSFGG